MNYLKQLLIILLFCFLGQLLETLLPLPIPAAIYGLVLLLIALCSGLLKPESIADTARYLIRIMSVFFVAPAVQLLQHWGIIAPNLAAILIITLVSTWIVFCVSGLVTQWLLKRKGGESHG